LTLGACTPGSLPRAKSAAPDHEPSTVLKDTVVKDIVVMDTGAFHVIDTELAAGAGFTNSSIDQKKAVLL
jgi:hypothetical protein